jgi:tRNA(Ile)-lysidine synthase
VPRGVSSRARVASPPAGGVIKSRKVIRFLTQVAAALDRIGIPSEATILLALSGGPDSVALLHALAALKSRRHFKLIAAHLNHRLRGKQADQDAAFVRQLCTRLGIDLVVERAKGLTRTAPNLEERARELRYRFLHRIADRVGASQIALAHHAGDQAETVLMRLLRGAGATGLAAMDEAGPNRLIRPLLELSRPAIMDYLHAIGAEWVTDSSNQSPAMLRNRIRLDLMPLIEREFTPGIEARLTALAGEMRGLDRYISAAACQALEARRHGDGLTLNDFRDLDPILAAALLREYLRDRLGDLRHIARNHIAAIAKLCANPNPSGRVTLPGGWQARREYQILTIAQAVTRESLQSFAVRLKRRGATAIDPLGFRFDARLIRHGEPRCSRREERDPMEALFDAVELVGNLTVRTFHPGDRIAPQGMRGTRKVQDVFVDRKLPRECRARWPLVVAGGEIIWIPGMARSRHALVTPETREIQYLRAIPASERTETIVA